MIKMALILRIRLPFIVHESYANAVLSRNVDYSNLHKELISRQFPHFSNPLPETEVSIRRMQVAILLECLQKGFSQCVIV